MGKYAILQLEVQDREVVRRTGDMSPPKFLFIVINSTDEETLRQINKRASELKTTQEEGGGVFGGAKRSVEKHVVEVVYSTSQYSELKAPSIHSIDVLWRLIQEACDSGWEPYASFAPNNFLFRKKLSE